MAHKYSKQFDLGQNATLKPDICSKVPPEIWVKIFEYSEQHGTKHLSKLRFVCKLWQQTIEENFDIRARIDDRKMDMKNFRRFQRVNKCIVSNFVETVPQLENTKSLQLFKYPALVTSLNIRGHISRENFWLLTEQCQHVTEFVLTEAMLTKETNMFGSVNFQKLTQRIKTFVATGISMYKPNLVEKNLRDLMNSKMSNLTKLVLRVTFPESFRDETFVSFFRQCQMLQTLELTLRNIESPSAIPIFLLQHLTTLKLEVCSEQQYIIWLPLLKLQNSLKTFCLLVDDTKGFTFGLDDQKTIFQNKLSLEHVEIGLLSKYSTVDPNILFQDNRNLKHLKMRGCIQPRIVNLNSLPMSIETLELYNFECMLDEFEEISNRIPKVVARNNCFNPKYFRGYKK